MVRARGGIKEALDKQVTLQRQALIAAMKCLYWLCKQEIAHTTNYEPLLSLVKNLGCTHLSALNVGGNAHYTSERIIQELVITLAQQIEDSQLHALRTSPFYGLMIDESTDVSITKHLVLYGRYISELGEPCSTFLRIVDLVNGTAECIEEAIRAYLVEKELPTNKMMGFGSDGAAVMTDEERDKVSHNYKEKLQLLISHYGTGEDAPAISAKDHIAAALIPSITLWMHFPSSACILSTIQKQYQFFSTLATLIYIFFDIADIISVLFISYCGERGHKHRWLGADLVIQGLGCLVFATPQFFFGAPTSSGGKHGGQPGVVSSGHPTPPNLHQWHHEGLRKTLLFENCSCVAEQLQEEFGGSHLYNSSATTGVCDKDTCNGLYIFLVFIGSPCSSCLSCRSQ
eukprot:Em0005g758a